MYTVFLTGGIGSGKSTARKVLQDRGARVIDLDEISHEILEEPEVQSGLSERFGSDILIGGTVDRARLAERAFATEVDTAALNALTHPHITARLKELLSDAFDAGEATVTVVEVPLIEHSADTAGLADEIIAITCPAEVRRVRAVARGMDPADFDARDASQLSDAERATRATTVIANDRDEEALATALNAWWDEHIRS